MRKATWLTFRSSQKFLSYNFRKELLDPRFSCEEKPWVDFFYFIFINIRTINTKGLDKQHLFKGVCSHKAQFCKECFMRWIFFQTTRISEHPTRWSYPC